MSTEIPTMKFSEIELKGEFAGRLECQVTSTEDDPTITFTLAHWHPFMQTTLHITAEQARELAAMLIEHAERVTR